MLVEKLHCEPEQDLGVEVLLAVGRDEVVEIECERGVADALAAVVDGGVPDVPPPGVRSDVVEEEVELGRLCSGRRQDPVGRKGAHADAASDGRAEDRKSTRLNSS